MCVPRHGPGRLLACILLLAVAGCRRPPSDEERIRALVDDAARAAAEKRVADVVVGVSESFRGEGLDRQGLKRLVAFHVLRGSWLAILVAAARVDVRGDEADAVVDVVMSRTRRAATVVELPAAEATVHRFALRLARERAGWRVTAASWHPITIAELLSEPPAAPR